MKVRRSCTLFNHSGQYAEEVVKDITNSFCSPKSQKKLKRFGNIFDNSALSEKDNSTTPKKQDKHMKCEESAVVVRRKNTSSSGKRRTFTSWGAEEQQPAAASNVESKYNADESNKKPSSFSNQSPRKSVGQSVNDSNKFIHPAESLKSPLRANMQPSNLIDSPRLRTKLIREPNSPSFSSTVYENDIDISLNSEAERMMDQKTKRHRKKTKTRKITFITI